MKKLLKKLVILLSVSLCIGIFPAWAEEGASVDFNYYNSFVVITVTENPKIFTPNDFPEIHCSSVITAKKSKTDNKYTYELILILQDSGDVGVKEAMSKIESNIFITAVVRNSFVDNYAECATEISLNHSSVFLAVGKTVDLNIEHLVLVSKDDRSIGVDFTIDPTIIDDSELKTDSFEEYGVSHFWPNSDNIYKKELGGHLYYNRLSVSEGTKSEIGNYFGEIDPEQTYIDVVNKLAQTPGITSVAIVYEALLGGGLPYEKWNSGDAKVADITLSGGTVVNGFPDDGPKTDYTATVTGLTPGTSSIVVERGGFGAHAKAECTVNVYLTGDVNGDGVVAASDALLALRHSVNRINLDKTKTEYYAADIDNNGIIKATDALHILQISVGKL